LRVEAEIFHNTCLKDVVFCLIKIFLIKNFPIDLYSSDTSVSQLELFGYRLRVSHNTRHGKTWRSSLVVKANLVNGNNNWASLYSNTDGKLKLWQTLYIWNDSVIKFTTNIVINGHCYGDLRVCWKVTFVWIEDDGNTFIVWKVIILVLLNFLCLCESIARYRRKLLCLLMFIRENRFSPLIIANSSSLLHNGSHTWSLCGIGGKSDLLSISIFRWRTFITAALGFIHSLKSCSLSLFHCSSDFTLFLGSKMA
jgi:hypothetical protein